ncbi:MAG TPA: NifU family protein [Bacteroidota bacterium]|nr:NifU family protein [Bacteroidota bacterium]
MTSGPENQSGTVAERVERALDVCRPYLQADGGDVRLMRIDNTVAEIAFQGTCIICPMSRMTLRAGIERAILKYAPEIKRVESVAAPTP